MTTPRVFISYSHDSELHREAVLQLAQQLRSWGIDAQLDRFVPAPVEGWPRWMMTQIDTAAFVVLVCTESYARRFEGHETAGVGKGVTFEGLLAIQHLYDASTLNRKFIPIIFEGTLETAVPLVLRPYTRYSLPGQFEALYRHLTGQPEIEAAPLRPRKVMPPRGTLQMPAPTGPVVDIPPSPRRALPPGSVCSPGGGDVQIEPLDLLHRLLLSLFSAGDQFRDWVALGPDGLDLVTDFPGSAASTSAAILGGLDVLHRRGYLDADFFTRLAVHFARRGDDVARVAAIWRGASASGSPAR